MFKKTIFATDLSPASEEVLKCLKSLQAIGVEEIVLTHALGLRYMDDLRYELIRMVEPQLKQQAAKLEEMGFSVCIRTPRGLPTEEILRVTGEQEAGLIVIGSHGHTLAHDALLGSTAMELIHRASVPLLIERLTVEQDHEKRLCQAADCDMLEHVLYATDFSDNAEFAFDRLKRFVEGGVRSVTLLHVQDAAIIGKISEDKLAEYDRIDQERLDRKKAELEKIGKAKVTCLIAHGHGTEEILKAARENPALTLMGSQGRGFFKEIFLGSTSANVARHAPGPVMIVPMPR